MTVKTINKSQYHQLLGLKTMADKHNQMLAEIVIAMAEIVDERDDNGELEKFGHAGDTAYTEGQSVDEMLRKLKIKVVK